MEIASDAANEMNAEQVENLLPPHLDIPEISRGLVLRVEQMPQTAPVQVVTTSAVKHQQFGLGKEIAVVVIQMDMSWTEYRLPGRWVEVWMEFFQGFHNIAGIIGFLKRRRPCFLNVAVRE